MTEPDKLKFLEGLRSPLAERVRRHDWSGTSMGSPEQWPQSLRSVVSLMLGSGFPMFVAWGPQLHTIYNDGYVEIMGAKHPGGWGMPFLEIWHEIRDDLQPFVEKVSAGETFFIENLPLTLRRHGYDEETWFTFSWSPVLDDRGAKVGIYCACTETTRAVLAERHVRLEHERLAALFQQAPGFLAVLRGPEHIFENFNDAYQQLVGFRTLRGLSLAAALPEVVEQGFIDLLDQAYLSGQPFQGRSMQVVLNRTPGSPPVQAYVDFVFQPTLDAAGTVQGIIVQGHDVTEQYRSQLELRRADQRKDEFLATLAHELRNPLAPVSNAIAILRSPQVDDGMRTRMLDLMERQTRHLVRLVDDLLEVSRITSGKIELRRERLDLRAVAQASVDSAHSAIQEARHQVTLSMPPHPVWVHADPARMKQVMDNMLNNAVKYTAPEGRIEVTIRADDRACVSFRDNGAGIPSDMLGSVFELFAQVDQTIGRAKGGLGIGLALVRQLVSLHGGEVHAASDGLGSGSTFTVLLPLGPIQLPSPAEPIGSQLLQAATPKRVLIIDDNRDAADSMADVLRICGHTVEAAYEGEGGLALADSFLPDCILLDIGMPGMDGHEVARALRAKAPHSRCMIVAITGWGQSMDRERTRQSGFDSHLVKPAAIDDVMALLDRA
ncbi:MAG: ATP-binding protein [Pseudomonadota bacterium]